jgi:hypothetical protein
MEGAVQDTNTVNYIFAAVLLLNAVTLLKKGHSDGKDFH